MAVTNYKACKTCKFSDLSYMQSPCDVCLARDNFPEWWPKEPELQRCPFCGSRQLTHTNHGLPSKRAWITCEDCGATGPFVEGVELAAAAWNERAETSRYVLEQAIGALRSENERKDEEIKRLRDNLIQCRAENAELYDYGANLRIAIRKARKVLRQLANGATMYSEVIDARQILKDALKEGK